MLQPAVGAGASVAEADARTGRVERVLDHEGSVYAVDLAETGAVATGGADGKLRVFLGGALVCEVPHDGPIVSVAFSRCGERLLTLTDIAARLIDSRTGWVQHTVMHQSEEVALARVFRTRVLSWSL